MKMIKKRINRNRVTLECDNLQKKQSHKINKSKRFASENTNQQQSGVDFQKFPSPTFNIHIHVPSYSTNDSKIYLPQIQPIIHLHFDEIAKKLEINTNDQSEESNLKAFKNLLPMTLPKLWNVRFHFQKKSKKKYIKDSGKNDEIPWSFRSCCNDCGLSRTEDKQKIQPGVSESNKMILYSNTDNNISEGYSKDRDSMMLSRYKDLKIKKAVVILTDIFKSKSQKNSLATVLRDSDNCQNEDKSSDRSLDQAQNYENEKMKNKNLVFYNSVKLENELCSSHSLSPKQTLKDSYVASNGFERSCSNIKLKETIMNASNIQKSAIQGKSLTALAEGCSFSEILSKFRVKCNEYVDCTEKGSKSHECHSRCNTEGDNDYFNEATERSKSFEEDDMTDLNLNLLIKKAELDLVENNVVTDQSVTDESENSPLFQVEAETNVNLRAEKSGEPNQNKFSKCEEAEDNFNEDNFEFSVKHPYNTNVESDECIIISRKHLSSEEVTEDSETLDSHASIEITNFGYESDFEISEKNCSSISNDGDVDFQSQLIKKEMGRRSLTSSSNYKTGKTSKSRRKAETETGKSDKSSPPKKMKDADKNSEEKKWNSAEGYIPLKASGPTKFAVASLDKINPYKTHSSKNFKKKMLFGNRVARFSTSNKLHIYQLKQQAARSSNK